MIWEEEKKHVPVDVKLMITLVCGGGRSVVVVVVVVLSKDVSVGDKGECHVFLSVMEKI